MLVAIWIINENVDEISMEILKQLHEYICSKFPCTI